MSVLSSRRTQATAASLIEALVPLRLLKRISFVWLLERRHLSGSTMLNVHVLHGSHCGMSNAGVARMPRAWLGLLGATVALVLGYFFLPGLPERNDVAQASVEERAGHSRPNQHPSTRAATTEVRHQPALPPPTDTMSHVNSSFQTQQAQTAQPLGAERDPRLTVRWGRPGLCNEKEGDARLALRSALIKRFHRTTIGDVHFTHDSSVQPTTLAEISATLLRTKNYLNGAIGWAPQALPPPVIVYQDAEQLRSGACVHVEALGYYDGDLHVADGSADTVRQTTAHEYVHHALQSIGITKPMWLHEGLAMAIAEETWWQQPQLGLQDWLAKEHLPFAALVDAFPHTADARFAHAAYYQSLMMLRLVLNAKGRPGLRQLVNDLASGAVTPQQAFSHAVGLSGLQLEAAWSQAVTSPRE